MVCWAKWWAEWPQQRWRWQRLAQQQSQVGAQLAQMTTAAATTTTTTTTTTAAYAYISKSKTKK